jgi:hypothetical protein
MSHALTTPNAAGVAALASLRTGLAQVRSTISSSVGGQPLLRLLKDGAWVMGREDNAVPNGTEAIVNPMSFQTGYSCWTNRQPGQGKNEMMGEEMWGIGGQKPPASTLPQHNDPRTQELCAWREQMSVDLKFLDGAFAGQQALYKTSSVGGLRALTDMLDAIMREIDTGSEFICPIIQISSDSYQHASYGRTYVPKLEIVSWANMQGQESADDGAPAPVDEVVKAEPAPAPAPAAAAPEGRRRRV